MVEEVWFNETSDVLCDVSWISAPREKLAQLAKNLHMEGLTEAGAELMEALLERRGCVCILWVPAHGGGIAPNAYADAAAKSHLAEAPADIPLWSLPRTLVYAVAQDGAPPNGTRWCLLAARPLRRLMVERLTHKRLDEWLEQAPKEARSGARTVITARGADARILTAMSRSDKAGTDREHSATGRSQRLRGDDVGMPISRGGEHSRTHRATRAEEGESDDSEDGGEVDDGSGRCELCGDGRADGLHALHCAGLRGAEHARSEVETALCRAAMAIPTGEVGAGSDTAKEWRREARETAPISVAQCMDDQPPEVEHGESREFSMEGASSGWCKSKERMEVRLRLREDGSEPPELELTRYCALATWNAYEAAAGAGGQTTEGWALREAAMSIGVTRQGPHGPELDASAVEAAEGEARTGIRRLEVEYGQLHAETAHGVAGNIRVGEWRGEEGRWLRERSANAMLTGRWTIATQRRFRQGQGAHGRKIVECMAVSPCGEVYSVAPATAWPWRLCYHVRVGRLDPDMPGHLQVKVRLTEGEKGRLEATVRAEVVGYTGEKLRIAGEGWVRTAIAPTEGGDSGVRMLFGVHGWPSTTPHISAITGAFAAAIQAVAKQAAVPDAAEREQQWRAVRTILAGVVPTLDAAEKRWEKEHREQEATAEEEQTGEEEQQQEAAPGGGLSTTEAEAYDELGVAPGAGMAQVRSVFRKLALRTHPDRPGGDGAAFRRVEEAMRVISEGAHRRGATTKSTQRPPQTQPRAWELIVTSLTTGSEALFRAISAHQRATRRRKEQEAAAAGTTIAEQREHRRAMRQEVRSMEREAATEAARTAMRAEAARVQQARRARGVTEAEALASLEGRRALQALILDPEYIRKHYEVWLPNGMWGKKHEETGGHTPFEIVEYDIRSKEGALDGATLWCKLEASSAALICKCEVNQTVLGGERTWGGARCFWAPKRAEEEGEEEMPGEEVEELEAAEGIRLAMRARGLMREAAAARRAAGAACEREGEQLESASGNPQTRTHRTTGDARIGFVARLEFLNSWKAPTMDPAMWMPPAKAANTRAEAKQAARRTLFAARAAAAAAGEKVMWSLRQQTAAGAMAWAEAEARLLTAARATAATGATEETQVSTDAADIATRAMEGQLPSSSAEARRGRRWLMEKVIHAVRTAGRQGATEDTLPLWIRATGVEPRGKSTRERLIAGRYVDAARAAQLGQQEGRREAPTTTGVAPEGEELGRAEEEDGEDGPAADGEEPQAPMADSEMPQAPAADEEMTQAPGGEEPMWTRMRQMQASQTRLQELVSSQRTAGTRTGLGTEGERPHGSPRAGWTHVRFVRATQSEEGGIASVSQAGDGPTQATTPATQTPPEPTPSPTPPRPPTSTPVPPPPPLRPIRPPPLPPLQQRRRGVIAVGRLRRGDIADFMPGDGTGRLHVRWRNGEIQVRIDRETWLGNPLTMADTWNVEERRKVCEGCVLWRREGGDLRYIAGKEGMRLARPPDRRWVEAQHAHAEHWAAMAELTALATWSQSIRLMCWCRHGPAGEW